MATGSSVLVLGVGNTLMQDDGVGVHVVRGLAETYELPPRVRLLEAGVIEFRLLAELSGIEYLLLIDAMEGAGGPGDIYRLDPGCLPSRRGPSLSAHETGVPEVLAVAKLLDRLPPTRILGVQPLEANAYGLELTPALRKALPRVVLAVVEELRTLGIAVTAKPPGANWVEAQSAA